MKLSRLEILRRTIKYIRCLQEILDYLDSEEGVEERRRRLEELRAEEAAMAAATEGTEVLMTLPVTTVTSEEPPSFMEATEVIQLDEAQLAQHEVVGEVVELRDEEGHEQPTYICITLGQ